MGVKLGLCEGHRLSGTANCWLWVSLVPRVCSKEETGGKLNSENEASWFVLLNKYDWDDQTKDDGMGGARGTYVCEKRIAQREGVEKPEKNEPLLRRRLK